MHLKVETGLNRFGLRPDDDTWRWRRLYETLTASRSKASPTTGSRRRGRQDVTYQQYEAFKLCAERLPWVPLHHISSTGALLDLPDLRLGLVRTGIGLYGYYPSDEVTRPVTAATGAVAAQPYRAGIEVPAGESVGYGRTWTAPEGARVALVMAGMPMAFAACCRTRAWRWYEATGRRSRVAWRWTC